MSVRADKDRCMGYGNCAVVAPDVFDLGDDDKVVVLREDAGADDDGVAEAVRECPAQALIPESGA
jgi:ferredoxin